MKTITKELGLVTKELKEIAEKEKKAKRSLTAEAVLNWAKEHRDSAIAQELTWSDKKAAHEFRLEQCRKLIQINLRFEDQTPQYIHIRARTERPEVPNRGYFNIEAVGASKTLRNYALWDAFVDLERVKRTYDIIKEDLSVVWDTVEKEKKRHFG